jgi:hypothetical protein
LAQFQTNPWKLSDLLARLDGGKIVLPEFQRSFVWKPPDIDLLLTSLVLDYPAGSLLFLRADPSNPLAWRPVEGVDLSTDGITPEYLVLDGQQRLTSLSVALNGRGEHLFYVDLRLLEDEDLENAIYPLRRSKAEQKGLTTRAGQFEAHTYPLTAAMGVGEHKYWFEDYVDFHVSRGADRDDFRQRTRQLQERFVDVLRDYRFPVVELPPDTSLEAVCQIFETLNKTGVRLTVFDLLTARFWPLGLDLRQMFEDAIGEHPLIGPDEFDVEPTFLLQAVSLVRSGLCKRGDLLVLQREGFEEDWERVCAAASSSLAMLRGDCGVLTRNWLPYGALFPALFATATHIHDLSGPEVGAAWDRLRRWFWCSTFGQRYDGPVNTTNAADYRQLVAWLQDDEAIPESISGFRLEDVNLRSTERQRSAVYRGVVCLTIVNGARDFYTGNRLTADFLHDPSRQIEDHHLFPSGFVRNLTPPRRAVNSILNRALIDHTTNRLIRMKAPSDYLEQIAERIGAERLEGILSSHLIPSTGPGALVKDDLDAFLGARERLLQGAIASVTGAFIPEPSAQDAYLDPARPFSNELALRRVLRSLHGNVLWYEQHMTRKSLELLAEELDKESVRAVALLSGPTHVDDKARRAFERFAEEMSNVGIEAEWRILPADEARGLHARAIFDDTGAWELPPLNLLLMGTVDSIRASEIDRTRFEAGWRGAEPI